MAVMFAHKKMNPGGLASRASLHRIAVLSDTHGKLPGEAASHVSSAEMAIHAGDFDRREVYDALSGMGKIAAVRGNCDGHWAAFLPREAIFDLYGKKVCVIHDQKKISPEGAASDIIISGHTHRYMERREGGRLMLNPGSCGGRRGGATMAMLIIDSESGAARAEKISLGSPSQEGRRDTGLSSGELGRAVALVIADIERERSIEWIAKKRGLHPEAVEQICQIYLTHPGIGVQGVLNRIEIAGM